MKAIGMYNFSWKMHQLNLKDFLHGALLTERLSHITQLLNCLKPNGWILSYSTTKFLMRQAAGKGSQLKILKSMFPQHQPRQDLSMLSPSGWRITKITR